MILIYYSMLFNLLIRSCKLFSAFFIICGFLPFSSCFAQIDKANRYYTQFEYNRAIPFYLKALKKGDDPEALSKLGHCYRFTGDYAKAEVFYERAVKFDNVDADVIYYYGEVLKSNKKIDKAREAFIVYSTKKPNDSKGENQLMSCERVQEWSHAIPQYELTHLPEINSKYSDFSPHTYENGLVFVSDRNIDFTDENKYGGNSSASFLAIYQTLKNGQQHFSKPRMFNHKINNELHNGPITFNSEQNLAFFNRVPELHKGKSYVNKPQMYFTRKAGLTFQKPEPFPYNNPEYAFAHPSLSTDGNTLFFVSDMPGGLGGKDIYVSRFVAESWSKPENLGSQINTSGDEMFPFFHSNGVLYFASNGQIGYGGLDIFSSKLKDGKWAMIRNLKEPVNSTTDDFGLVFVNDSIGYISSNRAGGMGSDDIYQIKLLNTALKTDVNGVFLYSKLNPASYTGLSIRDLNNVEVAHVKTNRMGEFNFNNLEVDKDYLILFDEKEVALDEGAIIYLTNEFGDKVAVLVKSGKNVFKFKSLSDVKLNQLPSLTEKDIKPLSLRIFGKAYEKLPGDVPVGMDVYLVNDAGEILYATKVDDKGNFEFDKLPQDMKYSIKLADVNTNAKVHLLNDSSEVVETIRKNDKGEFLFDYMAFQKAVMELMEVKSGTKPMPINMFGQLYEKLPGDIPAGMKVYAMDDAGKIIAEAVVDEKGNFIFDKLPPDKHYSFKLRDENLAAQMIIMNEEKEIVEQKKANSKGEFVFDKLTADKFAPLNIKDAGKGATLIPAPVMGVVYEKLPGDIPAGMKVYALDDAGKIIAETTLDERGNFVFNKLPADKNYTFKLKDEGHAAQMVILNEVNEIIETVKSNPKGEFVYDKLTADKSAKLDLKATDGGGSVKPVMMMGQVYQKLPGDVPKGMKVFALDDGGKIIAEAVVDAKGNFVFDKLPPDKQFTFKLKEEGMTAQMVFVNAKNEILETIKTDEKGAFNYDRLLAKKTVITKKTEKEISLKVKTEDYVISNIYYDFNKSEISFESSKQLDKVADILKKDPDVHFELSGHTDSKGSDQYNLVLSQKRAQAAAEILFSKGVNKKSLKVKGYGESNPIAPNEQPDGSDNPDGRSRNRRTEFKMVKK